MTLHNIHSILSDIPEHVILVAASKGKTAKDIEEAIDSGIKFVGESYIQEAENKILSVGRDKVTWHMIGHLQSRKVKKAILLFDMIETIDSFKLASIVSEACEKLGKIMPVLIEINSGEEQNKTGIMPSETEKFIRKSALLKGIKIEGLMTMGPLSDNPEEMRPYFRLTKGLFEHIKACDIPNISMKYLSMGMSDSYKIALEEGASIIRIGSAIFGQRSYDKN